MKGFSANLGFLWTELPLADAIRAAARHGFDAVECHFPYDQDANAVREALAETGLPMLGLNTIRGDLDAGEFGLCALPGQQKRASIAIDQAIDYAVSIGARAVHCMAGRTIAPGARIAFLTNLSYAATRAEKLGMDLLIEPINHRDAPDYHLSLVEDAAEIIDRLPHDNIRIMFDCYHTQIMQGDLCNRFARHIDQIGHVQIASVPDRTAPDHGELDYAYVLKSFRDAGYQGYVGAEYRPDGPTEDTLGWLPKMRCALGLS